MAMKFSKIFFSDGNCFESLANANRREFPDLFRDWIYDFIWNSLQLAGLARNERK